LKLYMEAEHRDVPIGTRAVIRLVVFNDEDMPVVFNRGMLLGPNLSGPKGPLPLSAEPQFDDPALNDVGLNPGCFYGRERGWADLPAGEYEARGLLMGEKPNTVALTAEPLRLHVG
jgi:hypothetical protein